MESGRLAQAPAPMFTAWQVHWASREEEQPLEFALCQNLPQLQRDFCLQLLSAVACLLALLPRGLE